MSENELSKQKAIILGAPDNLSDDENFQWHTTREIFWAEATQKIYDRHGITADAFSFRKSIQAQVEPIVQHFKDIHGLK